MFQCIDIVTSLVFIHGSFRVPRVSLITPSRHTSLSFLFDILLFVHVSARRSIPSCFFLFTFHLYFVAAFFATMLAFRFGIDKKATRFLGFAKTGARVSYRRSCSTR
jgi:hypothetical protein